MVLLLFLFFYVLFTGNNILGNSANWNTKIWFSHKHPQRRLQLVYFTSVKESSENSAEVMQTTVYLKPDVQNQMHKNTKTLQNSFLHWADITEFIIVSKCGTTFQICSIKECRKPTCRWINEQLHVCCKRKSKDYTYLFQALLILIIQFHRFLYSTL